MKYLDKNNEEIKKIRLEKNNNLTQSEYLTMKLNNPLASGIGEIFDNNNYELVKNFNNKIREEILKYDFPVLVRDVVIKDDLLEKKEEKLNELKLIKNRIEVEYPKLPIYNEIIKKVDDIYKKNVLSKKKISKNQIILHLDSEKKLGTKNSTMIKDLLCYYDENDINSRIRNLELDLAKSSYLRQRDNYNSGKQTMKLDILSLLYLRNLAITHYNEIIDILKDDDMINAKRNGLSSLKDSQIKYLTNFYNKMDKEWILNTKSGILDFTFTNFDVENKKIGNLDDTRIYRTFLCNNVLNYSCSNKFDFNDLFFSKYFLVRSYTLENSRFDSDEGGFYNHYNIQNSFLDTLGDTKRVLEFIPNSFYEFVKDLASDNSKIINELEKVYPSPIYSVRHNFIENDKKVYQALLEYMDKSTTNTITNLDKEKLIKVIEENYSNVIKEAEEILAYDTMLNASNTLIEGIDVSCVPYEHKLAKMPSYFSDRNIIIYDKEEDENKYKEALLDNLKIERKHSSYSVADNESKERLSNAFKLIERKDFLSSYNGTIKLLPNKKIEEFCKTI